MNTDFSTNPEDYRQLNIKPGTRIGLIGDYDAPTTWSYEKIVVVSTWDYIILERKFVFTSEIGWDTGILISLQTPFESLGFSGKTHKFSYFILVHRYSDLNTEVPSNHGKFIPAWQDDISLMVYGIKAGEKVEGNILSFQNWVSKSEQLSAAAMLSLMKNPSEYFRFLISRGRQLLEIE